MVIQFNTCRLNGTSLNSASQNSVGESLHAPVGGGGSIVPIPPTIPEEPEEPTPIPTFVLSASVSNGVVLATLNGSAISLPYEANEGDVIVLEVTPTDGFSFEGWADGVTDNPRTITMTADVVLSASCVEVVAPNKHIVFADAEVERVLMSKGVSSDGVGITKEDAERVTSLQNWFQNNNTIKTFDELRYFTNLTRLNTIPFLNCTSLQSIDLGNIIEINASAFNGCTALVQDIETEKVVGELGQGAFRYAGITSLIAPNATSCGTNLCDSCPNITKADVRGMTKIGHFAFQRCPNLVDVNISSVVQLDVQVFYECTSLKEIDVPSSVQSIGEACFFGCSAMEKCIIRATTPPTLSTRVFVNNNCIIYVPDASLEAYKTATNWNTYADRIKPLSEIEDYYVSDALLMHLDGINKGNVEGEWQDLVSGNSFVNHGAIAEADGWRFDGASSYMDSTTLINKGWWQSKRTMEVDRKSVV